MRVSREQVRANRARILDEAGRLYREKGFDAVSLADVMQAAGLTHGGFYRHFASKDALIAAAVAHDVSGSDPAEPLTAYADSYLGPLHRDCRGQSCPVSSLGTEASRAAPETRAAMTAMTRRQLQRFERGMPGETEAERRQQAIAAWSTMIGAMVLARLVDDRELSDEILSAARAELPIGK